MVATKCTNTTVHQVLVLLRQSSYMCIYILVLPLSFFFSNFCLFLCQLSQAQLTWQVQQRVDGACSSNNFPPWVNNQRRRLGKEKKSFSWFWQGGWVLEANLSTSSHNATMHVLRKVVLESIEPMTFVSKIQLSVSAFFKFRFKKDFVMNSVSEKL